MKAKLVKHESGYILYGEDNITIGAEPNVLSSDVFSKLSLKNCQAIENGYDLDDLASERLSTRFNENSGYHKFVFVEAYKEGFLKAMEIIGDKKFDEFLDREKELGISDIKTIERIQWYYKTYFDKSQQTEWDVEIEMEEIQEIYRDGTTKYERVPKINADGCLILKRINL